MVEIGLCGRGCLGGTWAIVLRVCLTTGEGGALAQPLAGDYEGKTRVHPEEKTA